MRIVERLIICVFSVYWIDAVYFNGTYLTALSRIAHEMSVHFG
jgi:hypothetical protein